MSEQYKRGRQDFLSGKDHTDCPYSSSRNANEWYRGWSDALTEDEERKQREGYNADRG